MLTDRQKLVLKAIIEEYVLTNEPVGSKSLADTPYLDSKATTLRYEMQFLEENGYLEKEHTSSGRVPSAMGYRYYVENLIPRDDSILKEFDDVDKAINSQYYSKNEAIKKVMDTLSDVTGYMAVITGSAADHAVVKKLEIVPLDNQSAVLLVVTSNGAVQSQVIDIPEYASMDDLMKITEMFDNAMYDRPVYEIREILNREASKPRIRMMVDFKDDILNFIIKCFLKFENADYYEAGFHTVISQPEFREREKVQQFVNMIGEGIITKILEEKTTGLTIQIGSKDDEDILQQCTIISTPYVINDEEYGKIALVGPVRMDYKKVIPLLEYTANAMSKIYKR